MGSFVPVFQTVERLELLNGNFINRAHNDFLEVALEAGALGILVVLFFGIFVLLRAARMSRSPSVPEAVIGHTVFYAAVLVALHSALDYPLRNELLLVVVGFLVGLLRRPLATAHNQDGPRLATGWGRH